MNYCWLTNKEENLDVQSHFKRGIKSIQQFHLLWNALLPEYKFEYRHIDTIYQAFKDVLASKWSEYNFNVLNSHPNQTKFQKSLSQDIPRTIGKHRKDHNFEIQQRYAIDPVLQWFSYMLNSFNDFNIVPYMQGFCDLLIPIFHICLQAILVLNDYIDIVPISAEIYFQQEFPEFPTNSFDYYALHAVAISVSMFKNFIKNYFNFELQMRQLDDSMAKIAKKLKQTKEFSNLIKNPDNNPSSFAGRWLLLLFTQDLRLADIIEYWNEIFKPDSIFGFPQSFIDRVIQSCFSASLAIYYSSKERNEKQFIEFMQNTTNLSFSDMKKYASR